MLDSRFFKHVSTRVHDGCAFEAYETVYARSTMVLFSRKTKTPLAALTLKAEDVGCMSMLTGRPSPRWSADPFFQGMLNMPDQVFDFTISNLSDKGMINFNILHTPHRVSNVNPGPAYAINEVNELHKDQSYTIQADQRTNRKMVLQGMTHWTTNATTGHATQVPTTVQATESSIIWRSGLYFYLSVVPDISSQELVQEFAEGTIWKVAPGFVRRATVPKFGFGTCCGPSVYPAPAPVAAQDAQAPAQAPSGFRGSGLGAPASSSTAFTAGLFSSSNPPAPTNSTFGNFASTNAATGKTGSMFGTPAPTSTTTTTPFGGFSSTSPAPAPQHSAFGNSVFGASSSAGVSASTTGLFGSNPQAQAPSPFGSFANTISATGKGGSMFGSPTPTPTTSPFGGFSSTSPAPAPAPQHSAFGNSVFGAPSSTGVSTTGLFGSNPPAQAPSPFGCFSSTNSATGSSSQTNTTTTAPFSSTNRASFAAHRSFGSAAAGPTQFPQRNAAAAHSGAAAANASLYPHPTRSAVPVEVERTQAAELQYGSRVNVESICTGHNYAYFYCSEPTVICMSIWPNMKFQTLPNMESELNQEIDEWIQNKGKNLIESLNAIYKAETCVIDLESKADTIICTCGHQCIHHANVRNDLRRCPLCRSPVVAFVTVHDLQLD